jgi:hypothetical protein
MKQEEFQVVAELYRFLATFDPTAISEASKLPSISDNLRTALNALHRETTTQEPSSKSASSGPNAGKRKNGGSLDPLGLLLSKQRFPSKHELQQLAKALGIKLKVDAKDSHDRVARRIAAEISQSPTLSEKLYELVGADKDTQTAGWIELIRRGS